MTDHKTLTLSINPLEITQLFAQANAGHDLAHEKLVDIFYQELKTIASQRKKSFEKNNTLNTTALVNETWLKLNKSDVKYNNKKHFLSVAAVAMRQVLLDDAKSKMRLKRPDFVSISTDARAELSSFEDEVEMLYQLDQILIKLEKHSPRLATIFNLKFFCGLTLEEIAEQMDVSKKTAQRDWEKSKQIINDTFNLVSD